MYFFSQKRYKPKSHWGTYLWGFIHTISFVDDDHHNYTYHKTAIEKLHAVKDVLPCPKCRDTYISYLKRLEHLDLDKSLELFYWSVDLHNAVNAKLGKGKISTDEAIRKWCK
jgi:hypothetical protein